MPNENLTNAAKQAMTAQETGEVILTLLTLYYDDTALIRIVDNTESITSNGHSFEPCTFSVNLPDQTSEGYKSCRLQIDNTDLAIYRTIKETALKSRDEKKEIKGEIAVIMASEPNSYVEGPLTFALRNITTTVNSITGEMYDSYLQDMKFTNFTYNPQDFPGMFW